LTERDTLIVEEDTHMDRLVKFVGNGPAIIINPKYVVRLEGFKYRYLPDELHFTHICTADEGVHTVAGTPEQVAEALGYQLVAFDPTTGLPEGSEGVL
jgi:hypothetical protein